ncbi:MAG: hypothetical protein ACI8X5_004092, partial [Planctomycetota bacterium]
MITKLLLAASLTFASLGSIGAYYVPDDLEDLVAEVKKSREETDLQVLDDIADLKTRAAAQALIELYTIQGSLYMRIEIIKRLQEFDDVGDASQLALQMLADAATDSEDYEVREAALDALDNCPELGKNFLEFIVGSAAEDDVREKAMDLHVKRKIAD